MALSRKLKSSNLLCSAEQVLLAHIKPNHHLIIALSGGIDSVVLLHWLATLSKPMQFALSAVHVNHGISQNALLWSKFCRNLCHAYDIPIYVAYLQINKQPGMSLEAVAREERYRVFSRMQGDYVVLAQHLDDQAETLLLQLLRGAGIRGLSAMPVIRKAGEQFSVFTPQILRPLLEVSRSSIESYARQHQLNWINDESNDSIAFNRNFLRHEILPLLRDRYPNYPQTLLRTSRHLSEASSLLEELAEIDFKQCQVAGRLQIHAIKKLSASRARNLLRYVLLQQGINLPSTAKLADIWQQITSERLDHKIHINIGNAEIRCFKGVIYILRAKTPAIKECPSSIWHGETHWVLPQLNGTINFIQIEGKGIQPQHMQNNTITIRTRQGGEHFQPACHRPRRSLKNLLQENLIPPWERNNLPLLFCGEKLAWVPGIGIECEFQVKSDEFGFWPSWSPEQK